MINECRIETMDQLSSLVSEQIYRPELKRHRDLHVYRGMSNADFKLTTSLFRNCKQLSGKLERPLLHNFTKYAVLEEPIIEGNIWKQMIVGQHHGIPTRLLDWSFSPLMALHFAMTETDLDEMAQHDAAVWKIDIDGAGSYRGEINAWLRENGIAPFTRKSRIDLQDMCESLLYRLPEITWVRAKIRGVILDIDITRSVVAEEDAFDTRPGNVIASSDGIVQSVRVFQGTAAVRPGDTVKKGQTLIYGYENREDGRREAVRAKGEIRVRTWKSADALVYAGKTVSVPTGRETVVKAFLCPWGAVRSGSEPEYLACDKQTETFPIGGACAMRKLLSLCDKNDEIIDKWLNCCMIEGDTIQATATAELIAETGVFSPQIPD